MHYNDDLTLDAMPPEHAWKPTWWTPMKSKKTLGNDIAEFTEQYYKPPRGKNKNSGIKLDPFQLWLYQHVFELNAFGLFRYREVYIQIPRKNGKSLLGSSIGNYFATRGEDGDEIYFAAKNFKQAQILFKESKRNILSTDLKHLFNVRQYDIRSKDKNITMAPLTSSSESAQGLAPYISICDEIHVWDSKTGTSQAGLELLNALLTGSGDREESMVIEITTAGSNTDGMAYSRYQKGKMIARGELVDDSFGFFCWEAEEEDDISSPATILKANPGIQAGYMLLSEMQKKFTSAATISTADFERYHLNKWIRSNEGESFLTHFSWQQIKDEKIESLFDKAARGEKPSITLGFDGSLSNDSTGLVAIDLETHAIEVLYAWEKDYKDPDWFVDVEEVDIAFRNCFELFDVQKVYLDPSRYTDIIQRWQKDFGKLIVRDIPQSLPRMGPMTQQFKQDVFMKVLKHNGESRLESHALHAIETVKGMVAKESRNSHKKIDFLVCAILANGARLEIEASRDQAEKTRAMYAALAGKY